MGCRLKIFVKEWEKITNDQWVLSVLKQGYKLVSRNSTKHMDKTDTCKRYIYFNGRGRKIIAKGSNRTCAVCGNQRRFLQFIFSVTKKTTGDKLEISQQVSSISTFQNGFNDQSHKSSQERRLGNFRSKRCISTCTHISRSKKVSSV